MLFVINNDVGKDPAMRCLETKCNFHCTRLVQLRKHLGEAHGMDITEEFITFKTFSGLLPTTVQFYQFCDCD